MAIELLTREDIREVLKQELPKILAALLPKQDEVPVTGKEICTYSNISRSTLEKYREQGKIPYLKLGRSYRYIKSEVIEALTKHGVI